jgi:hypothetical protein
MDSLLNIANINLVTLGLLFSHFRLNDLAVANTCALIFLNANTSNKFTYVYGLFANGFTTFVLGYPYFLVGNVNSGVYMCALGLCLMMISAFVHYREYIFQYAGAYQPQDETQEEDEEEIPLHARPVIPEVDSGGEDETDDEDYSDMPPLIPVGKPNLRVEIPPVDTAALLASAEEEKVTKKED